ncbi:hypothetical protein Athai_62660 [Actinocatenispora thailandica]|uniref:Uncharacterized protein n=1 Tax=Actinocatenispora thailandica TaxID=227318 RepID=A0A7R7HZY7_9ACTN|nr:hypothetical protein [Actinocatenispora thailandica]BCJ38763.1 hypothetical protein Athai_62660 [Actinocatenispora thailandica]
MPSVMHEALIAVFHQNPSLAAVLLGDVLGVKVPDWHNARLDAGETNELPHTEYRADAVVTLCEADRPVLSVVVEVQLRRDPAKRWSWPVYLATLRARLQCPVALLVVCPDTRAAAWCGEPIELGHPGWMLQPLVAGPNQIPVQSDTAELAVLSGLAHAAGPDCRQALDAANVALDTIDPDLAVRYIEIMLAALPEAARRYLEAKMSTHTFEFQSDYARRLRAEGRTEGRTEGRAEGEAAALLMLFDARGWVVSDEIRRRLDGCTDVDQLDRWLRRAANAASLDEVFD